MASACATSIPLVSAPSACPSKKTTVARFRRRTATCRASSGGGGGRGGENDAVCTRADKVNEKTVQCTDPAGQLPCPLVSPTDPVDFKPESKVTRIRQPVHLLSREYQEKYKEAVAKMKALPEENPLSFAAQAAIHQAYCDAYYKHEQHGFAGADGAHCRARLGRQGGPDAFLGGVQCRYRRLPEPHQRRVQLQQRHGVPGVGGTRPALLLAPLQRRPHVAHLVDQARRRAGHHGGGLARHQLRLLRRRQEPAEGAHQVPRRPGHARPRLHVRRRVRQGPAMAALQDLVAGAPRQGQPAEVVVGKEGGAGVPARPD
ncbi:polyphenol oxidase1 [Zea mays]|nr:polyphenol oxidase1 [Zea mays]